MGLWNSIDQFARAILPRADISPSDPSIGYGPLGDYWYSNMLMPNLTGVIGAENAWMFVSTSFAATRLLSGIGSSLPLNKTRTVNGRTETLLNDPVHQLLNVRPNPWMSAMTCRAMMVGWQVNHGTAFAEIQRFPSGLPGRLWPIHRSRVRPFINDEDGTLWWEVRNKNADSTHIPDVDMLRVPYIVLDDNGIMGMGVGKMAMKAIGLAQTLERTEQDASTTTQPRIVVESPRRMAMPEQDAFRRQWAELYVQGAQNVPALLVDGATAKPLPWSAVDADHKNRRQFTREDLACWYDVPPSMLRWSVKDTAGNTEQQSIDFQTFSLQFLKLWVQECDWKLHTQEQRDNGESFQFSYKELLATNHEARGKYFQSLFTVGGITPNQIVTAEGGNPSTEDGMDKHYVQGAMRPISEPYKGDTSITTDPKNGQKSPLKVASAVSIMLTAALRRMAFKESQAINHAAKESRTFTTKLDEFYSKHTEQLTEALSPVSEAAGELEFTLHPNELAMKWCRISKDSLLDAAGEATATNLVEKIRVTTESWIEARVSEFVKHIAA